MGWAGPQRVNHEGIIWERGTDGVVRRWDPAANQWVWWDPNAPGPRPPEVLLQPAVPGTPVRSGKRWPIWVGVFAVVVVLAAVSSGLDDSSPTSVRISEPAASEESEETDPTPLPEPEPIAEPDGTYRATCDYVLGDFTEYTPTGYRLIAQIRMKNTGNVGTDVKASASWVQVGTAPIKRQKVVKIEPGRSKNVNFTVPIGSNEIDLHQAADFQKSCKAKATIVDTYGEPQG